MGSTGLESDVAGTYIRHITERLLIDLSWASSALEGNTYFLLDTRELIERGIAAQGKDALETTMILNHKRAIEFLMDAVDYGMTRMVASNLTPLEMRSKPQEELERILALARAPSACETPGSSRRRARSTWTWCAARSCSSSCATARTSSTWRA